MVKGYKFNEALTGLINNTSIGKKFGASAYHSPTAKTEDKMAIIKRLEDMFYDAAIPQLLELDGYENLREVYNAKERMKN